MAVRDDFAAGEVLSAADLNDTFASKLDLAGGKILQIVRATDSTQRTTSSTSYVDASISVTITPQKSDSAVLLVYTARAQAQWSTGDESRIEISITDSSNNKISGAEDMLVGSLNLTGTGGKIISYHVNAWAYATPATTSATTYKVRFASRSSNSSAILANGDATGQLYAIEVSA